MQNIDYIWWYDSEYAKQQKSSSNSHWIIY